MKAVCFAAVLFAPLTALAQESDRGFEIHGTLAGLAAYSKDLTQPPRDGAVITGGFRALVYPSFQLNEHWGISGAVQLQTRPYTPDAFTSQGHGVKVQLLHAYVTHARVAARRSLVIRVGQLPTAFGSFPLRYDDAVNPLVTAPPSYGYYKAGVTLDGLTGAQVDATWGRFDARGQFVNSSPANRRSVFDRDQYGNWAGGAGITILQGFRFGVSGYRGPYLNRGSKFYFPGEAKPRDLPATAWAADVAWARGHWNAYGEFQKFQFDYRAIPTFREDTAYGEVRRALNPRLYLAARASYMRVHVAPTYRIYEAAAGVRPNPYQLFKLSYVLTERGASRPLDHIFLMQLVTSFRPYAFGK